ncbi:MAG TPA: DNA cytosine methyltransferase, partial [Verrucomicrobiae bacterium]|nr:DNA cytosine methyltransferase [Verrucomicrobiae bacterium]
MRKARLNVKTSTGRRFRIVLKFGCASAKQNAMQNGFDRQSAKAIQFIDLFCGIGGFRQAMENLSRDSGVTSQCVFSSDIDEDCRASYAANFGHAPVGDITKVNERDVPKHDLLLAGF